MKKHVKLQRKAVLLALAIVFVAALAGAGMYLHGKRQQTQVVSDVPSQTDADAVFRKYLIKSISAKTLATDEAYSGTGSDMSGKVMIDAAGKHIRGSVNLQCNAHLQAGTSATIRASVQIQDNATYLRLDDISGTVVNPDGQAIYLSDAYARVKGVWYQGAPADTTAQAQLNAGIFINNSSVTAPGYDANKIADALLNNKAYTYTANKAADGKNYQFFFRAQQQAYLAAVKQAFPALSSPEDIVNALFFNGDSLDSTLTIAPDGTLLKEDTTQQNLCQSMIAAYIGSDSTDTPTILTGTSTPKPAQHITIAPIQNAQPLNELSKNIILN